MSHVLTDIVTQYHQATSGWYQYLFPIASHLFGALALIEMAWLAINWVLDAKDITSIWIALTKKAMALSFFYAVLLNAGTWIPSVIQSFALIGAGASHTHQLYPSDILDQGVALASSVYVPLHKAGLLNVGLGWLVGGFISIFLVAAFAIIAGILVVTLIESYIVVGAGILLLGFAASRWTIQFASNYLSYTVSVGTRLFMLYLIIAVGMQLASIWNVLLAQADVHNFTPFFEVFGCAIVFLSIVWVIPAKAESLLSGATKASLGSLMETTGLVAGATAGTALAAGKMIHGATKGGLETIKQARTLAAQHQGNPVVGALKGAFKASGNLAGSMLSSAVNPLVNTASSMSSKTQSIKAKHAEDTEGALAQRKATPASINTASSVSHATEVSNLAVPAESCLKPLSNDEKKP